MADSFDAYHEWLGIAPKDQPPNHYRLLGVDLFEAKAAAIEHAADQRMALLRTFQTGARVALSQRLLNDVSVARICLLNPKKKAAYDAELRKQLAGQGEESLDAGLMEVLRESKTTKAVSASDSAGKSPKNARLFVGIGSAMLIGAILVIAWLAMPGGKSEMALRSEPETREEPAVPAEEPVPVKPSEPASVTAKPAIQEEPAPKPAQEKPVPAPRVESPKTPNPKPEPVKSKPAPVVQSPTPNPKPPPLSPEPSPRAKQPLPTDSAFEQAMKAARELFQANLDKAKTWADKTVLAKWLMTQAQEPSNDAAGRYALLRMAAELALDSRDAETAFRCVDQIDAMFEVDRFAMKMAILADWAKEARSTESRKWLVELLIAVGDEALDVGNVDAARELGKVATSKSVGLRDKEVMQRLKMFRQRFNEASMDAEELQQARASLAKEASHAPSNLVVGRYLCFTKGEWKKGLPLLALGSDATLKQLAEQELKSPPTEPNDQVALADAWWEIALVCRRSQMNAIKAHAGQWYRQALASLPAGQVRSSAERRLAELKKLRSQQSQPPLAVAPFDAKQAAAHQERWAAYLSAPVVMTNSIGMKLILIPPGEFDMGSSPAEIAKTLEAAKKSQEPQWYVERIPMEGPRHRVKISRPYYLGVYLVTQGEYERVMGVNPSAFSAKPMAATAFKPPLPEATIKMRPGDAALVAGLDTSRHPVDTVSWSDAAEFCRRLSELPQERGAKRAYRLPTEAEWECACRVGTTTRWWCGDNEAVLQECAWYLREGGPVTHPVGEKRASPWGLFDMHGQLWQWCMDWHTETYYRQSPGVDPTGPQQGEHRVNRGGSWNSRAAQCRSAYRNLLAPNYRSHDFGLRVCLVVEESSK